MAEITRNLFLPNLRHLRADSTMYVRHLRKGRAIHEGPGAAFWFRPRVAAIAQVPLDDREQVLLFRARTADFQEVAVQASVTYRIIQPVLATERIDFGIDPNRGTWNATPLETLGGLLTELAQQPAIELIARMPMHDALVSGVGAVRTEIAAALAGDERLAERGVVVTDVRVVAIRADADLERAMQTETRERVQQEADRATYERRAVAVERERAIAENELKNQIELARREEELVTQRGQNERQRATERAAAEAIDAEAQAGRQRLEAETEAAAMRLTGDAQAQAEAARLGAYAGVEQAVILGLAVQELARNLPSIEHLTITPDLLTQVANRFAVGAPALGEA